LCPFLVAYLEFWFHLVINIRNKTYIKLVFKL
ncbi:hypothetical protein, partial [Plasmodium yoelii yoelii]